MIIKKSCNFDCKVEGERLVIVIRGEIDHHSAVSVRSAIDTKLYEYRPRHAVLDLSEIDFMDSSGLGLIMGRYALVQKLGGQFSVANPNDRVKKIFELAGLGRIIKIEIENEDENKKGEDQR